MSGQWEVVGKGKQKQSGHSVKKLSKSERKKFVENAPKIEDILPLSQVKTLYTALENNKENRKPSGKENHIKENDSKKIQKKQQDKKKEPMKEKAQPAPKSLENAVKLIYSKEITAELQIGQARFQDAPLVWLKGLTSYLNTKLAVEHNNPTFTGKPVEYPLSLLSGEIKDILKCAIRDAGESVTQPFYDWCLTSMANDMTKATGSVLGYKMILQLMAFQNPDITVANIPKFVTLRNSYQNRQPIGLSILWAIGLGGFKDIAIGLKVWQQLMVSVIELRNYAPYVISYLKDILSYKPSGKPISSEQFFTVLDILYAPSLNLPSNIHRQELAGICILLKNRMLEVEPEKGFCSFLQPLLERLGPLTCEPLKKEVLTCLAFCLDSDPLSYSIWRQLYMKNLPQSALLLQHIDTLWKSDKRPTSMKQFKETLITFQVTNEDLSKCKQKEDGLEDCKKYCFELRKKMTVSRSFPWKIGSFLLLLCIGTLLIYDIKKYGSFKSSSTGRFLNDVGALQYTEHAWTKTKFFANMSYRWLGVNGPLYYKSACEHSKPYLQLGWDTSVLIANQLVIWYENSRIYIEKKTPIAIEWVDHYAPGLIETMKFHSAEAWEFIKHYAFILWQLCVQYFNLALEWIQLNIFTGNLSPKNLQKYSLEALNTTQVYAVWTFDWVCQKVQTLSKIH